MIKNKPTKGFSVAELFIAIALFIFLFSSGFLIIRGLTQSSTSSILQSKANEKLRTVAAQIQNEAVSSFDTMSETNADRTGFRDPQIRILSTIGPISVADRTRPVELTATFEASPGNVSTKKLKFNLSNTLSGFTGGAVKVRVISATTGLPVAGVYVIAPGQNLAEVNGVTSPTGDCLLYGVKLNDPASKIQLNGQAINAYFPFTSPLPANTYPSYQKMLDAFGLQKGVMRDLGTHTIILPAPSVNVHLMDSSNNQPIVDAEVRIYPQRGTVPPGTCTSSPNCELGGGFVNGFSGRTDGSGMVSFLNMIPGNYYVLVVGNQQYAAADMWGTAYPANNTRDFLTATSEQSVDTDRYTIQRGSLLAQVEAVEWDGNTCQVTGPVTSGTTVTFSVNDDYSALYSSLSPYNFVTGFEWIQSLVRPLLTNGVMRRSEQTDDSGSLRVDYIGPKIINSSWTFPSPTGAERQAIKVVPYAGFFSPQGTYMTRAPSIPVIVDYINGNPATPKFFIAANAFFFRTAPTGTPLEDFSYKIFTNDIVSENKITGLKLLQAIPAKKTLASAHGVIRGQGSNSFTTTTFSFKSVAALFGGGTLGSGAVVYNATYDANYIDAGYWVPTNILPDGQTHTFSFDKCLIPTLGTDRQTFIFRAENPQATGNTPFVCPVIVWTRNSGGAYVQEANPNTPAGLTLRFKYYSNGFQTEAPDLANQSIVNGVISFSRSTQANEYYQALTTPVPLNAGDDVDLGTTDVTKTSSRRVYSISMVADTNNSVAYIDNQLFPGVGIPHSFNGSNYAPTQAGYVMQFARIISTHIHGTVRNVAHLPVGVGALVELCGNGIPTCLQTTTDANGEYHFPSNNEASRMNVALYPLNYDVYTRTSMSGMAPSGDEYFLVTQPYGGFTVHDVILNQSQGSSGGNG